MLYIDQFRVIVGDKDDCSIIELWVEMPMQCNYHFVEVTRILVCLTVPASHVTSWHDIMNELAIIMVTPLTCALLQHFTDKAPTPDLDSAVQWLVPSVEAGQQCLVTTDSAQWLHYEQ